MILIVMVIVDDADDNDILRSSLLFSPMFAASSTLVDNFITVFELASLVYMFVIIYSAEINIKAYPYLFSSILYVYTRLRRAGHCMY